jgi:hypothetical protein
MTQEEATKFMEDLCALTDPGINEAVKRVMVLPPEDLKMGMSALLVAILSPYYAPALQYEGTMREGILSMLTLDVVRAAKEMHLTGMGR